MEVESFLNPIEASKVTKGMYLLLTGKTCRVLDVAKSKTGKHGHMKVSITSLDVRNDNKIFHMCHGKQMLYEVILQHEKMQFVDHRIKGEEIIELDLMNINYEIETLILVNKEICEKFLKKLGKQENEEKDLIFDVSTIIESECGSNKYQKIKIVTNVNL
jgi:translation elongation factor P/translation initiation factor 5A